MVWGILSEAQAETDMQDKFRKKKLVVDQEVGCANFRWKNCYIPNYSLDN